MTSSLKRALVAFIASRISFISCCLLSVAASSMSPNATVHPPGPLQRRGVARKKNAAPVVVQRLVRRRSPQHFSLGPNGALIDPGPKFPDVFLGEPILFCRRHRGGLTLVVRET